MKAEKQNTFTFSVQAQLIRQMQEEDGHHPCYATPSAAHCAKKEDECCWRQDCYHEEVEEGASRSA